ncbi:efflux RND transporter periplasmic adaptor subunit [Ferriphaselus sp. R-1]|uniref:efflux RND transporter periplasmic adaptor subunit n=1 Tax=Ferriphaselus sp. R-1 TaxID=1485544 RepID=UPI0009DFD570|nr:efflux RND transporter periplasmic adaptor subunit [Ferriphaselus sp. R-1]
MNKVRLSCLVLGLLALAGCGKKEEEKKAGPAGTPVSVVQAEQRTVEQIEESVGTLDSPADPVIAAEVAGKVLSLKVMEGAEIKAGQVLAEMDAQDTGLVRQSAQAEVRRMEGVSANETRRLERMKKLREQGFISQAGLDDVAAQATSAQNQLASAKAQLALAERNVGKTHIVSPLDGRLERQFVVPGQYLKVGDPAFRVVYMKKLRARLPFPEEMAGRIQPGMEVHVSSPGVAGVQNGKIDEVRPMSGATNRSFDAFAVFDNPGWKPGATVTGAVVLGRHANAVVVPELSVVLRPAGKVVYVLAGDKVAQRVVQTGAKQSDGTLEIVSGLKAGETVVVDGAGFLTDQAPVAVSHQEPAGKPATPAAASAVAPASAVAAPVSAVPAAAKK